MSDKENGARVAWATVKLTGMGRRPANIDRLAAQAGLPADQTLRLLRLIWRHQIDVRDGLVHLNTAPTGPRRYRVHADGQAVGSGKGCSVDMYLLALALGRPIHTAATCPATGTPITIDISPDKVERIEPATTVVALIDRDVDLTTGPDRTDTDVCAQQPFFASPQAASDWLAGHPGGRIVPVGDFHAEARRLVDRLESSSPPDAR